MEKELDALVSERGLAALFELPEFSFCRPRSPDTIVRFEEKADGSLINSYMHNDELRLKSKTSLTSIMAVDAMAYLELDENRVLKTTLEDITRSGVTVIMEWCDPKPESRIVLFYSKPQLRIFAARNISTGDIVQFSSFSEEDIAAMAPYRVERTYIPREGIVDFLDNIPDAKGIEGYVAVFPDETRIKIKTSWYCSQHRLKDSVSNPHALFICVIEESSDDLKSVFFDNPGAMQEIEAMERHAIKVYADMIARVEKFYDENHTLDRKSYAIKGKDELVPYEFSLAMFKYLGKVVDYKTTIIKHSKKLLPAAS